MKKGTLLLSALMLAGLASCGTKSDAAAIDYGTSARFTKEDLEQAFQVVDETLSTWEVSQIKKIRYSSDDNSNNENLAWLNSLKDDDETYTECIMVETDFHTKEDAEGAWEADADYNDYQWWLARTENGEWQLMTWGY
ncbi:MAG: hypothetical protein E7185_02620 [Erysipelotrichaceae bacterium]|nr:hypothetical protein [Erysipelotrichaceae bacterium]